jgi:hypothetical protein
MSRDHFSCYKLAKAINFVHEIAMITGEILADALSPASSIGKSDDFSKSARQSF